MTWRACRPALAAQLWQLSQSVESTVSEKPWRVYVLISTVVAVLHVGVGILLLDYGRYVRRASATKKAATGIVELDLWKGGAIANPDDMI